MKYFVKLLIHKLMNHEIDDSPPDSFISEFIQYANIQSLFFCYLLYFTCYNDTYSYNN